MMPLRRAFCLRKKSLPFPPPNLMGWQRLLLLLPIPAVIHSDEWSYERHFQWRSKILFDEIFPFSVAKLEGASITGYLTGQRKRNKQKKKHKWLNMLSEFFFVWTSLYCFDGVFIEEVHSPPIIPHKPGTVLCFTALSRYKTTSAFLCQQKRCMCCNWIPFPSLHIQLQVICARDIIMTPPVNRRGQCCSLVIGSQNPLEMTTC